MCPATAKPIVDSVLKYFAGFIQFAQLRNDRDAVWHWQECWCLVFSQFFGSYKPARPSLVISYPNTVVSSPVVRPRWFIEKYSRPARKVTRQMTVRLRGKQHREYFYIDYDVLECGHKIAARYGDNGTQPAKWRYCGECPPKESKKCLSTQTNSSPSRRSSARAVHTAA